MIPFINFDDLDAMVTETLDENSLIVAIALDSACQAIRDEIHQTVNLVRDDTELYDGYRQEKIVLRQGPVVEIVEVVEDDVTLAETDDYILSKLSGILWRIGDRWARGRQNIAITYDHGWAVTEDDVVVPGSMEGVDRVPSSIRRVALELAMEVIHAPALSTVGAGGITGETIGDYTYTVDAAVALQTAAGAMTDVHRKALESYRAIGVSL